MRRTAIIAAFAAGLTATALPAQEGNGQGEGSVGSGQGPTDPAEGQQAQPSGDQPAQQSSPDEQSQQAGNVITAEMLETASVVSLEGEYNETVWQDEAPLGTMLADLTEIGLVEDVVLSARGEVQGVTVDVGGFLGIGSKAVLIPLADIRLARPDPGAEELTVVTRLNQQRLEELPEFEIEE